VRASSRGPSLRELPVSGDGYGKAVVVIDGDHDVEIGAARSGRPGRDELLDEVAVAVAALLARCHRDAALTHGLLPQRASP
jgi:hypothetical protein